MTWVRSNRKKTANSWFGSSETCNVVQFKWKNWKKNYRAKWPTVRFCSSCCEVFVIGIMAMCNNKIVDKNLYKPNHQRVYRSQNACWKPSVQTLMCGVKNAVRTKFEYKNIVSDAKYFKCIVLFKMQTNHPIPLKESFYQCAFFHIHKNFDFIFCQTKWYVLHWLSLYEHYLKKGGSHACVTTTTHSALYYYV